VRTLVDLDFGDTKFDWDVVGIFREGHYAVRFPALFQFKAKG